MRRKKMKKCQTSQTFLPKHVVQFMNDEYVN